VGEAPLSTNFWRFVNNLNIPVNASMTSRQRTASGFAEQVVGALGHATHKQVLSYRDFSPQGIQNPFSEKRTGYQTSDQQNKQSQSALDKRLAFGKADEGFENMSGTSLNSPGQRRCTDESQNHL